MTLSPTGELLAVALLTVVHLIGAGILIWAMLDGDRQEPWWRGWWPRDDGPADPPQPPPGPPGDVLGPPLTDAAPAAVRLREPGRIGDALPRPGRRPSHPRDPAREPAAR